jgi:hypothetical protein
MKRIRPWYVLACVATIAAGLASRRFPQLLPAFLGKCPGDALWALMVFWGLGAVFLRASTARVAAGALVFCFGIETLKLWQVPWLVSLRHTTLGHLVFGHVFSWQNFVAYTAGVLLGTLIEMVGGRVSRSSAG